MAGICTSTIFDKRTLKVADAIVESVNDLRSHWPLTVRQVYYQLVGKQIIPNNIDQYRKVSRVGVKLRENDIIPWYAIEDRTRRTTGKRGWENVSEWLQSQFDGFCDPKRYGRCYVQNQDVYIEVSTEKDALSRIIEEPLWMYCTRLNIVRGQVSATMVEQIAERFDDAIMRGQEPILLHFGDLDPTGIAIPKAIERNLFERHGVDAEVRRVALTPEQVREYGLPSSLDAIKPKDPNLGAWLREYGPNQHVVELDALHPDTLTSILRRELESTYNMESFAQEQLNEAHDRETIKEVRNSVQDFLHREYPELFGGHYET